MTNSVQTGMENKRGRMVAIIAMFFLFAMIAFVTNLAAPIGTIWGNTFQGSSFLGMLGNMMNFLAYLLMGIPAGKLLMKIGYKKTVLLAIAIGLIGIFVQWLSGIVGGEASIAKNSVTVMENIDGKEYEVARTFNVTVSFIVYLIGAFVGGFCVCMLNTAVNPMLNLLGGGGKKGNQLLQTGGSLNSLAATITPYLVGALIGQLTRKTAMSDVAPLLWIAMGVFVLAFIGIFFVSIPEPKQESSTSESKSDAKGKKKSALNYRHCLLGVIAIFFYVGIEVGIPSTLNFYLSDQKASGAGVLGEASAIAGAIVAVYWLLMLVGRMFSGVISGKVSTRAQLVAVTSVALVLIFAAIMVPKESRIGVPSFLYDAQESVTSTLRDANMPENEIQEFLKNPDAEKLKNSQYVTATPIETKNEGKVVRYEINNSEKQPHELVEAAQSQSSIPMSALLLILCGLCTSVMWGGIFNLSVDGLGKYTAQASGFFMTMVVGGGILPQLQQLIVKSHGYMESYWLIFAAMAYIFIYAIWGSINKAVNNVKEVKTTQGDLMEETLV